MSEQLFYDNGQITVTNARFIFRNQTIAIRALNSVSLYAKEPERFPPLCIIFIGAAFLGLGFFLEFTLSMLIGIGLIIAGIIWLCNQNNIYYVRINTSSGLSDVFSSPDRNFIQQIVNALNEAIISQAK